MAICSDFAATTLAHNKALNSAPQRVAFLLRKSLCNGLGHVSLALYAKESMVTKFIIIGVIVFSLLLFFIPVAKKSDPKPTKKETWKCFFVGVAVAALVTPLFYNAVIIPIAIWVLLFAGGVVPWWSKYKKPFAYQWGMFFGISIGLGVIFNFIENGI